MGNSNLLFESLFKIKISAEDKQDYLDRVVAEHPYFSPAQFYLLQQMPANAPGYDLQASKTSILFNNPHWLHFQLQECLDIGILQEDDSPGTNEVTVVAEADEKLSEGHSALIAEQEINETEVPTAEHPDEFINQPEEVADNGNEIAEETVVEPADNTQPEPEIIINENADRAATEDLPAQSDALFTDVAPSIITDHISTEELAMPSGDEHLLDIEPAPHPEEELAATGAIEHINAGEEKVPELVKLPGNNGHEQTDMPLDNDEDDDIEEKEIEPLNFKLNLSTPDTTEETISFEPLHTTDYFASQGIKLSGEIRTNDKLGKQLKSFTEWLKTMKKIHTDQPAQTGNQTDVTIQKLAERSNAEDEVVTEAMADVLIQQGKGGKAIEVYKKLSLLNPSKNAYFAAKIDQLKEQ